MKIDTATCKISIAGETALEYGEETSESGKCKTSYITSEEGKPFSIIVDLSNDPRNYDKKYTYHIYVDGELAGRYYAHVGATTNEPRILSSLSLQTPGCNGYFRERALKFKKLNTVDTGSQGSVENRLNVLDELGTIKIFIWSCILINTNTPTTKDRPEENIVDEAKSILESKLKGRDIKHRATLGPPKYVAATSYQTTIREETRTTFIFKYSAKESLIYQGIIPREADEVTDDDEASGRENLPQLKLEEMNFEQMRAELRRRRERDAEDDELHHKVKREIKQEARRRPLISNGHAETIDLTGDD